MFHFALKCLNRQGNLLQLRKNEAPIAATLFTAASLYSAPLSLSGGEKILMYTSGTTPLIHITRQIFHDVIAVNVTSTKRMDFI